MLSKDIYTFFSELEQNNHREWFTDHKTRFKALEAEVKALGESIVSELQSSDQVEKMKLFRVYRDVRFSKDKTPYKTHFGMAFHRLKPEYRGGYYIHLKPEDSFLAVGFWDPNKEDLLRIRKEIEMDASEFREILRDKTLQNLWGNLTGDEVKTAPKGFSKEHPDIDLIKKKQYLFIRKLSEKEVFSPQLEQTVVESFRAIRPFFNYMSSVLTTDLNGESLL